MLKTIFCLSLFFLTGCKNLEAIKEAPVHYLFVMDYQHNVCSLRQITDKTTLASRWLEDRPLSACDGYIALDPKTFMDLRTYIKEKVNK